MSRILIFGGTTEGRLLAQALSQRGGLRRRQRGHGTGCGGSSPACPASPRWWGGGQRRRWRPCCPGTTSAWTPPTPTPGRFLRTSRSACRSAVVPLRRLLRRESQLPPGSILAGSPEEAAQFLQSREGNILLAIGAKGLSAFSGLDPERLYPRVLPVEESLSACRRAGVPTKNIIAMHGPFSQKLNEAILEQYRIRWMVTKDGGSAGGFGEKVSAAQNTGGLLGCHWDGRRMMGRIWILFWIGC